MDWKLYAMAAGALASAIVLVGTLIWFAIS
jgi:hypothetical protein